MSGDLFAELEGAEEGTRVDLDAVLAALKFNVQGLVPAIAQSSQTGQVLMLAWMNLESLRETLSTGQVCYFSRSRGELWRKGETSGNWQKLVSLRIDCDGDALLLEVEQTGPACHTNRTACFYLEVDRGTVKVSAHD